MHRNKTTRLLNLPREAAHARQALLELLRVLLHLVDPLLAQDQRVLVDLSFLLRQKLLELRVVGFHLLQQGFALVEQLGHVPCYFDLVMIIELEIINVFSIFDFS